MDCPGIRTHYATLCQSIFGPIRYYGDVQRSTYTMPPSDRVSLDSLDTMKIPGLSRDPHTPCHPLTEYLGLLRHYGDPGIVQRSTCTMPPSDRVSMDSIYTMEIVGLSRNPHTPCHRLSEYLWSPRTLWRSQDCPEIHIHYATL